METRKWKLLEGLALRVRSLCQALHCEVLQVCRSYSFTDLLRLQCEEYYERIVV